MSLLANLMYWLIGWAKYLGATIINFFVDMVNSAIDGLVTFIASVVSLFPDGSSLPSLPSIPSGSFWDIFILCLNWIFPMAFLVSAAGFFAVSVLAYITIAPLARWVKLLR